MTTDDLTDAERAFAAAVERGLTRKLVQLDPWLEDDRLVFMPKVASDRIFAGKAAFAALRQIGFDEVGPLDDIAEALRRGGYAQLAEPFEHFVAKRC